MKKQRGKYRGGRKRRMEKFQLTEISFVDKPAQAGATADLRKMDVDDLLGIEKQRPRSGESFSSFFGRVRNEPGMTRARAREMFDREMNKAGDLAQMFTSVDEGHQHGIHIHHNDEGKVYLWLSHAAAPDGEMHDHQVVTDDDGEFIVSENMGHTHTIDGDRLRSLISREVMGKSLVGSIYDEETLNAAIEKFDADDEETRDNVAQYIEHYAKALGLEMPEQGKLVDLLKNMDEQNKDSENMDEDLKKAQGEIETLTATVATLTKVAAMSAGHKAFYDTLGDEDKTTFLEKSDADRDTQVANAQAEDPVIYTATDGTQYRKSDDQRLVAMAMKSDESIKKSDALAKQLADADLAKRAEAEFGHIPGGIEVRKAMLRQIDAIPDEAVRKQAMDGIRAQAPDMSYATKNLGVSNSPTLDKDDPQAQLEKMAADLVAKDPKLTQAAAFVKVLDTPEGQALYEQKVKN